MLSPLEKKKKTRRKNLDGLKEHEKHLSDMFTMNKQTLQFTACTMSPIVFARLMKPKLYKKQCQVTTLQGGKSPRIQTVQFDSLIENKTWMEVGCITPRSESFWMQMGVSFKPKRAGDGTVERFKVRLEANGYALKYVVDYDETFTPEVRSSTVRFVLALQNDLLIHQMGV